MALDTLKKLYVEQLQDLYNAENQLLKALPKMVGKAKHTDLQEGFQLHLRQTEEHARRLEQIFQSLGERPSGVTCEGMKGLVKEAEQTMKEKADSDVLDAALIADAQRVEHYEIAGYGCVRTYARLLGRQDDVAILQRTLAEEKETDEKLTQLAERVVNVDAAKKDREVSRGAYSETGVSGPPPSGSAGRPSGRSTGPSSGDVTAR